MTDTDKIKLAKRILAASADLVTEYLLSGPEGQNLLNANTTLIMIRETCQDALGAIMQESEK